MGVRPRVPAWAATGLPEPQAGVACHRLPVPSRPSPKLSTCWLLPVTPIPGQGLRDFLEWQVLRVLAICLPP